MAASGSIWEGYRLDATPIRSYDDLILVARARMAELQITFET
jgi:hypothetical protein